MIMIQNNVLSSLDCTDSVIGIWVSVLIPTISLTLWLTGSSIIKSEIAHSLSFFAKGGPALFMALMPVLARSDDGSHLEDHKDDREGGEVTNL